eukprot:scaffold547_cov201-Pinguiococcus_pyrenoidosus.AAC.1
MTVTPRRPQDGAKTPGSARERERGLDLVTDGKTEKRKPKTPFRQGALHWGRLGILLLTLLPRNVQNGSSHSQGVPEVSQVYPSVMPLGETPRRPQDGAKTPGSARERERGLDLVTDGKNEKRKPKTPFRRDNPGQLVPC